jgi:hypothetical protein
VAVTSPRTLRSTPLGTIGHPGVRFERDDLVLGQGSTKSEHVGSLTRNVTRREAHDRQHLWLSQSAWIISTSDRGAGLLDPNFSRIDLELQGGTSGHRMWSHRYHRAHKDLESLRLIEAWHV